jgi:hypothetical protein
MSSNSNGSYQSIVSKKILSGISIPNIPIEQQKRITESINEAKHEIQIYRRSIIDYERKIESLIEVGATHY